MHRSLLACSFFSRPAAYFTSNNLKGGWGGGQFCVCLGSLSFWLLYDLSEGSLACDDCVVHNACVPKRRGTGLRGEHWYIWYSITWNYRCTCVTWLLHLWDMSHSNGFTWLNQDTLLPWSARHVACPIQMCVPFICVTRLNHIRETPHWTYVRCHICDVLEQKWGSKCRIEWNTKRHTIKKGMHTSRVKTQIGPSRVKHANALFHADEALSSLCVCVLI